MKNIIKFSIYVLSLLSTTLAFADIVIDGGPTWNPPGMGIENASGDPASAGGHTVTYTGIDLSQTENLYYGTKNDIDVCGFSMDGGGISGSEIFVFSSATANSITYTGSTIIETEPGPTQYVNPTRMTLTFTGPGAMILDGATSGLGNANCDVGALWRVEGDFSVNILMEAQVTQPGDSNFGNWEPGNDLFDRLGTTGVSASGTGASVDYGFYFEDLDSDGDGIGDSVDNCTLLANPTQCDADMDGYGNRCDADFDNNGIVNNLDVGYFRSAFGTIDLFANLNCDVDTSGIVNNLDAGIFRSLFGSPPGPSALAP